MIIVYIMFGAIFGIIVGVISFKIWNKIDDKRQIRHLKEVIWGKRDNKTEIDGKIIDVNKFVVSEGDNDYFIEFGEDKPMKKREHRKEKAKDEPKKKVRKKKVA